MFVNSQEKLKVLLDSYFGEHDVDWYFENVRCDRIGTIKSLRETNLMFQFGLSSIVSRTQIGFVVNSDVVGDVVEFDKFVAEVNKKLYMFYLK